MGAFIFCAVRLFGNHEADKTFPLDSAGEAWHYIEIQLSYKNCMILGEGEFGVRFMIKKKLHIDE